MNEQYWDTRWVSIRDSGGPTRIYDAENADPEWKPRPVGFRPKEEE